MQAQRTSKVSNVYFLYNTENTFQVFSVVDFILILTCYLFNKLLSLQFIYNFFSDNLS